MQKESLWFNTRKIWKRASSSPKNRTFWLVLILLIVISTAMSAIGDATGDFSVKSFSPQGAVQNVSEIKVSFSRAAVEKDSVGKEVLQERMPLDFTPYLDGRGRWVSPESFVFTPKKVSLAEATSYLVRIKDGFSDTKGNQLKGKRDFEFSTAPLRFLEVRQVDFEPYVGRVLYQATFSAPVSARKLYGFMEILDADGRKVDFQIADMPPGKNVNFFVSAPSESYTLKIAKGLPPEVGPLGLDKDITVKLSRSMNMEVKEVLPRSELGNMRIDIRTTAPVDLKRAASFIEFVPPVNFELVSDSPGVVSVVGNFQPRDIVKIKVLKGFPSIGVSVTEKTWESSVVFADLEPSFRFLSKGRFAPVDASILLPIEIVNCDSLLVRVARVYENNLSLVARRYWPEEAGDYSEIILEKKFTTKSKPNEIIQRALDLKKLVGEQKGLFSVSLIHPDREWQQDSMLFNITDMGVTASLFDKGAFFWINGLSTGKPIKGARVSLWDNKNQLLARGESDGQGVAQVQNKGVWDANTRPSIAIVERGDDKALVLLENSLLANSDFQVGGQPYVEQGYEAFCFTPRGVFRPGDRVPVRVIVRDVNRQTPKPFPIEIKTIAPDGRVWKTTTAKLTNTGSAETVLLLPASAPTGMWRVGVSLPGMRTPIGDTSFFVEDYATPRLRVNVQSDKRVLRPGEQALLKVGAEYLFGAVAAGLMYEVRYTAQPESFSHKSWDRYSFGDARVIFEAESTLLKQGKLDEAGRVEVPLKTQKWSPPSILKLVCQVGVMEEGGRWNYSSLAIPYYPSDVLLGVKRPSDAIMKGQKTPFDFAAVSPEGKPASLTKATVVTYRVNYVPTVYANDSSSSGRTEEEYIEESRFVVNFNKGMGSSEIVFKTNGEYLVVVEGQKASTASLRVFSSDPRWAGEVGATLPDRVRIQLDKPTYRKGETATVRINAPFNGRLLMTVATNRVLLNEVREVRSEDVVLKFKVTQDMTPNAWVTGSVIRGNGEGNARAFGVVPLTVDNSDSKLTVKVEGAPRLKPSSKNKFSLTLTDSKGKGVSGEVTVMLVDTGVLSLTRFMTPSPWAFFFARRGLGISIYDVYSSLLSMAGKGVPLLIPGGGDDALYEALHAAPAQKRAFSPFDTRRFKTLSLMKTITTDSKGRSEFEFVIPEFLGESRLMAVAHAGSLFGSTFEDFPIMRDLVAEPALPRAVSPGDVFASPLQVFNQSEKPRIEATLQVRTEGPLTLARLSDGQTLSSVNPKEQKLNLKISVKQGERLRIPLVFKSTGSGVARVHTSLSWNGELSQQSVELPSRPPYPRVSTRKVVTLGVGKSMEYRALGAWLPGTVDRSVTLSGMPKAQMADLSRFLVEYPYGCLEQTVSGGWALLAQPELVGQIKPELAGKYALRSALADRIRRIQSLQLYTGAFVNWPGWVEESRWNSIYTTHFLVTAEKKGVAVPKTTLDNALNYLRRLVSAMPDAKASEASLATELSAQAYATYVLTLRGEAPLGWMGYLKDKSSRMTPSGRLLLASAYAKGGQRELASKMLGGASLGDSTESKKESRDNLDSANRTEALTLLAWVAVDPLGVEAANAARALQKSIQTGDVFTTQSASFALFSLSDYFSTRGPRKGESVLVIKNAKGTPLLTNKGSTLSTLRDDKITLPLQILNEGDDEGFVAISESGVPLKMPKQEDRGLIARQSFVSDSGGKIDTAQSITRGKRLYGVISLKPTGGSLRDVVVSAILPAGFEIENARLVEQLQSSTGKGLGGSLRIEERDDRLILFIDRLEEPVEWRYAVRAVTAGSFALPPIHASAMYEPGIFSLGSSGTLRITE